MKEASPIRAIAQKINHHCVSNGSPRSPSMLAIRPNEMRSGKTSLSVYLAFIASLDRFLMLVGVLNLIGHKIFVYHAIESAFILWSSRLKVRSIASLSVFTIVDQNPVFHFLGMLLFPKAC